MSSAVHWSCGQYVDAVTGARLKPISMTTSTVTIGGIGMDDPRPRTVPPATTRNSATPTTNTAPRVALVAITDHRGDAHGERTAEVAGRPAAGGEQEDDRREAGHHDREVRVQTHEHRCHERRRTSPPRAGRRARSVSGHERRSSGQTTAGRGRSPVAVQFPAHTEVHGGFAFFVRETLSGPLSRVPGGSTLTRSYS